MSELRPPTKWVVIATLVNVVGNIGLWASVMVYRLSSPPATPEDEAAMVSTILFCRGAGYALLLLNGLALLFALVKGLLARRWWWVAVSIIALAALAYEAVLIWGFYILPFIQPKQDGSFL